MKVALSTLSEMENPDPLPTGHALPHDKLASTDWAAPTDDPTMTMDRVTTSGNENTAFSDFNYEKAVIEIQVEIMKLEAKIEATHQVKIQMDTTRAVSDPDQHTPILAKNIREMLKEMEHLKGYQWVYT
ncbi:hypothetical protein X975_21492, partial [Stegodyphus mimosarum]